MPFIGFVLALNCGEHWHSGHLFFCLPVLLPAGRTIAIWGQCVKGSFPHWQLWTILHGRQI
ncbi:MAG: hypothetical protein LBH00_03500, partial [Planctomycetaceae bacterium]|nr:hypothetical protein [Planctomycetaceae bacterium]